MPGDTKITLYFVNMVRRFQSARGTSVDYTTLRVQSHSVRFLFLLFVCCFVFFLSSLKCTETDKCLYCHPGLNYWKNQSCDLRQQNMKKKNKNHLQQVKPHDHAAETTEKV